MGLNILLIGEFYSENLGDGVISENVKYLLESGLENVNVQIVDLSGREGYKGNSENPNLLKPNNFTYHIKEKLKRGDNLLTNIYDRISYKRISKINHSKLNYITQQIDSDEYDLAIFAGGQLIMDYFLVYIEHIVKILNLKDTPIVFNGIGFGTIHSSINRKKFLEILDYPNVSTVSVRDSANEINETFLLKNRTKAILTADPALWSSETFRINKMPNSGIIGIGVMYRDDPSFMLEQTKMLEKLTKELDEQKLAWEIFTNGDHLDYKFANEIYNKLHTDSKKIAERPERPEEIVEIISNYNSIISFRLHSHIIAASLSIPSIAVYWDDKVISFFKKFDSVDRVFYVQDDPKLMAEKLVSIKFVPLSKEKLELEKNLSKHILLDSINLAVEENI